MSIQSFLNLLARYRLHLSFLLLLGVIIEWQVNEGGREYPFFSWKDIDPPIGLFWVIIGSLLRSWAAGVIRKRSVLATEGPYTVVRHPLYLGSFLVALGLAQIMDDMHAILAVLVLLPLIYTYTIRDEEHQLADIFGVTWNNYSRSTGALFPRLPLRFTRGDWSWEQWWRNREWRILLRIIAIAALIAWWGAPE